MLSFLFSFLLPLAASDAVTGAIEQAQALAVKKQRQAATTSLKQALETLPAPIKSRGKIVESIHAISKIFFTDKGQKDFEVGQATLWENPDLALVSLRASLASEDGNILVQGHIARALLIKQECDAALATLASAREMNPFSSELAILELRALTCQEDFTTLHLKLKNMPALDKFESAYTRFLLAKESMLKQAWQKTFESALKVSEEQPSFPEAYWLLARASTQLSKDAEPWLQKYVSLCRAVTVRERKRFALEPRLCADLKEAEDELAVQKTADF